MNNHQNACRGNPAGFLQEKHMTDIIHDDRKHELKVWPAFFEPLLFGGKSIEIRKGYDRNFQIGDTLILREFDSNNGYTGREVTRVITYKISDSEFYGIKEGYVLLSITEPFFIDRTVRITIVNPNGKLLNADQLSTFIRSEIVETKGKCPFCNGQGKVLKPTFIVDPDPEDTDTCSKCSGTGKNSHFYLTLE